MKELVKKSKIIKDLLKKTQFNKTDQYKNINNFRRFIKFKKIKNKKDKLNIKTCCS